MPRTDERRPVRDGESTSGLARPSQFGTVVCDDAVRRAQVTYVWAHAYLVVGTRGRCRMVLVIPACPYCRRPHVHSGGPDFVSGKRTASCHEGAYFVLVGTVEGQVAS